MPINHLSFDFMLDTSSNNIIDVFFKPLLKNSCLYYRGVGYFSSSWIEYNSEGLIDFANNDGKIRWITSPILNEADWEALKIGEQAKSDLLLKKKLEESVADFAKSLKKETLIALAWMIADGIVEIKMALPCKDLSGEFHDKFGYFEDEDGNSLSFQGSNNESKNGTINNYESFTIFTSWDESPKICKYSKHGKERFLNIWDGHIDNLKLYDIPQSIKENIIRLRGNTDRPYKEPKQIKMLKNKCPRIPDKFDGVRDYQEQAFEKWRDNNYQGIFAMATGTGKTVTSLYCGLHEYDDRKEYKPDTCYQIVILVPTQTLVNQWEKEVNSFKFRNVIKAYGASANWHRHVKKIIDDEKHLGLIKDFVVISTYRSFIKKFESHFSKLSKNILLIADEVHNAGSPSFLKIITKIPYKKKIGLSATPKRIYDTGSTELVETFFNTKYPYTFSYSMRKAIDNDILCKYYYYPKLVKLSDQEFDEYCKLTYEIGVASAYNNEEKSTITDKQKMLLLQRKRLLNTAENKKTCLINIISKINPSELKYCLIYAPGGNEYFDHDLDYDEERVITQMQEIVNREFPDISQNRYLGETRDRNDIIQGFRNGAIDVLFAINCLDEGVDIPKTKVGIFTASTGNPRQFIQRRGRLLRTHPDKKFAYIYDMVVTPPRNIDTFEIEKRLVLNELSRVKYFLELSNNYYDFEEFFDEICGHYNISYDDIEIDEEMI
jgi:superfamily II DNA or RNA helicase